MDARVRAGVLNNYQAVAESLGLDAGVLLERAGLSPDDVRDVDRMIPAACAVWLLEESARLAECPSFGLTLAASRTHASVGPVSLLFRHLDTLGDIARALIDYQTLLATAAELSFVRLDREALVTFDLVVDTPAVQAIEFTLATLYRAMISAARPPPGAVQTHFMHSGAPAGSLHRATFDGRVSYGSNFTGFAFSDIALATPNPLADPVMARHARSYLDGLIQPRDASSATERAARALVRLLPTGKASLDQVSAELGMAPRSLQRALRSEHTSLSDVLRAVRRNLALRHIEEPHRSITEISFLAGFAGPSAFTRWFATEFGMSPASWRSKKAPPVPATQDLSAPESV